VETYFSEFQVEQTKYKIGKNSPCKNLSAPESAAAFQRLAMHSTQIEFGTQDFPILKLHNDNGVPEISEMSFLNLFFF